MKDQETFTGTLRSAVVVECNVDGTIQITKSLMSSSMGLRQPGDPTLPIQRARFEPGAYVECPLDINGTLEALRNTQDFTDEMSNLPQEVSAPSLLAIPQMILTGTQEYGEFMSAAAVEPVDGDMLPPIPLIFYEPQSGAPVTEVVALSLGSAGSPPSTTIESQLAGFEANSTMSTSSTSPGCGLPPAPLYVWMDFGQCQTAPAGTCSDQPGPAYLQYYSRQAQQHGGGSNRCQVEPSAITSAVVPFWTGPATVTIGYNPQTQVGLSAPLYYYEGWLDPDSAIRPSG